jgi:hypothetical protein
VEAAKETGAIGLFEARYGSMVKVYSMGDISKEICGGPHAENTADLGASKLRRRRVPPPGCAESKRCFNKGIPCQMARSMAKPSIGLAFCGSTHSMDSVV